MNLKESILQILSDKKAKREGLHGYSGDADPSFR